MFYEWLNIVITSISAIILTLWQFKYFSDKNINDITKKHPTTFMPSNWTFQIWGLIFGLQFLFNIYSIIHENDKTDLLWIFPSSVNLLAILWNYTFLSYMFVTSQVILAVMWSLLVQIYIKLGIHYMNNDSIVTVWVYYIPFSIYLAWITIANVANLFFTVSYDEEVGGMIQTSNEFEMGDVVENQSQSENSIRAAIIALLFLISPITFMLYYKNDYAICFVYFVALLGLYTNDPDEDVKKTLMFSFLLVAVEIIISLYYFYK